MLDEMPQRNASKFNIRKPKVAFSIFHIKAFVGIGRLSPLSTHITCTNLNTFIISGYSYYQNRCVNAGNNGPIKISEEFRPPYLDEIKLADIFRDLASKKKLTAFSSPTTFTLLIIAYVIANAKKNFLIHLGTIPTNQILQKSYYYVLQLRFCLFRYNYVILT